MRFETGVSYAAMTQALSWAGASWMRSMRRVWDPWMAWVVPSGQGSCRESFRLSILPDASVRISILSIFLGGEEAGQAQAKTWGISRDDAGGALEAGSPANSRELLGTSPTRQ